MVKKDKTYTLMASQIAAIYAHGAAANKISAIKEFRDATGSDLRDAKHVIEGRFEADVPDLKVGMKIRVSPQDRSWSYEGRIYEYNSATTQFKLIHDKCVNLPYDGPGRLRSEMASGVIGMGWNLEILPD